MALYHAVLGAIASGNATRGGIANYIGRKTTDIGHPLAGAWRNSQPTFLAQVAGPHFETICRDWAQTSGVEAFDGARGEVAAGVVADPLRRSQIQVDVAVFAPDDAVFAPDDPGRPRRVLSLGEAKWDKVKRRGCAADRAGCALRLTLG
jgi:uncharacterized protein